jgi:hypothetical protein
MARILITLLVRLRSHHCRERICIDALESIYVLKYGLSVRTEGTLPLISGRKLDSLIVKGKVVPVLN